MRYNFLLRVRLLGGLFIIAALLLLARLYFVQIVHGKEFARDAIAQYVEPVPETGNRGDIFFTSKDGASVSAAVMQRGWKLVVRPDDIGEAEDAFKALDALTPLDRERFFASAGKRGDPYEEVGFRIPDDVAKTIRARELPGVLLVQDQWRFYPAGELFAQTVGFVGYSGDSPTRTGVYGLEKKWNETLTLVTSGRAVNPFAEIFTSLGSAFSSDPSKEQGSIVTALEPVVGKQLEDTLERVVETYSPRRVGGIVMDPRTGAIIAMALRPTYDPNRYNIVGDPSVYSNQLVEAVYEMGSIMKPLAMAAALDAGVVTPHTTYDDVGCIKKSGKTICNYDGKARGVIDMQEVLNQSLNVGMSFVADKLGPRALTDYFTRYGLGERTGIDLPAEARGNIKSLGNGSGPDVNFASAAFGQGIAVTPVAMTRALSALANGGSIPPPHVVASMRYESGITRDLDFAPSVQVLKQETVESITSMLVEVFDEALLGGALKQEHYRIAAKTGTAQIANPDGGGYYKDRYLHSFFGYFPAYEPRFIVFLFVLEPHGAEFASATLARPFLRLTQFLINYYDIPPDR
jgi:cell division protein FtsI/penicillin-binding protein 2